MRLYGKNPVIERLKTNPRSVKMIYLQQGIGDEAYVRQIASRWAIPVSVVPSSKMVKLARSLNAQGLLAEVDDFSYQPFEDLLEVSLKKNHTLIFLDRLNDPQNLGVMMRTLACLGEFAIVIPRHESVEVTEAVLRIASGAENYILVSQVNNLSQAARSAKAAGYWIAGTVVEGGDDIRKTVLPFPLGLIVGSEQKGIREGLEKVFDLKLTLPMKNAKLSFNVAQITGILGYEINRQKEDGAVAPSR